MSSYDALAAGYDALMTDVGYKKRADWLVRQFRKSGVPVRQVLDLACGTGTMACLLARRGYQVTATDGSEEMLTQGGGPGVAAAVSASDHAAAAACPAGGRSDLHDGFPQLPDPAC